MSNPVPQNIQDLSEKVLSEALLIPKTKFPYIVRAGSFTNQQNSGYQVTIIRIDEDTNDVDYKFFEFDDFKKVTHIYSNGQIMLSQHHGILNEEGATRSSTEALTNIRESTREEAIRQV